MTRSPRDKHDVLESQPVITKQLSRKSSTCYKIKFKNHGATSKPLRINKCWLLTLVYNEHLLSVYLIFLF